MENQLVIIDQIQLQSSNLSQNLDTLMIEWFEIKKQKITRKTETGLTLELRLLNKKEWKNGDLLLVNDQPIASIFIKPCLCIQYSAQSKSEAADFCYFVGNRHLPIYWNNSVENCFLLPYDGRMYEQLSNRYQNRIELVDQQLTSDFILKNLVKN